MRNGGAAQTGSLSLVQEFHETLHSLLRWLAQAEAKLDAVNLGDPATPPALLLQYQAKLLVSERCANLTPKCVAQV